MARTRSRAVRERVDRSYTIDEALPKRRRKREAVFSENRHAFVLADALLVAGTIAIQDGSLQSPRIFAEYFQGPACVFHLRLRG